MAGWEGDASAERIGAEFGYGGAVSLVRDGVGHAVVVKIEKAARTARALAALSAVGDRLSGNVPPLLDGWVDEPADRGVLLFEHVAPAVQGDVLRPCSAPQAEALIDFVARLHSLSIPDRVAPFEMTRWERERWVDRVEAASGRFPELVGSRSGWLLDGFASDLDEALDRMESEPPVLIHGDLHLDNVLWRPGVVPVVLDWSNAAAGPPGRDLLLLVGAGIGSEHREPLLARYASGVGCSVDEVGASLRDAAHWLLRGVVGWAAIPDRVVPGSRMAAMCELGLGSIFEYLGR
jgi:aminoglycoside phosphotransferase (APT) family kinase protein